MQSIQEMFKVTISSNEDLSKCTNTPQADPNEESFAAISPRRDYDKEYYSQHNMKEPSQDTALVQLDEYL